MTDIEVRFHKFCHCNSNPSSVRNALIYVINDFAHYQMKADSRYRESLEKAQQSLDMNKVDRRQRWNEHYRLHDQLKNEYRLLIEKDVLHYFDREKIND